MRPLTSYLISPEPQNCIVIVYTCNIEYENAQSGSELRVLAAFADD